MCTDLLVVSKDGKQVVSARSQEDNAPADYRLILRKKDVKVQLTLPKWDASDGKAKLENPAQEESWTSKHNYAGLMMTTLPNGKNPGIPISNAVFDGMNDAGLSASSLLFRGAHYQDKSENEQTRNVFVGFFIDWLLSNYSTCAEVRSAFENDELRVVADNPGGFTKKQIEDGLAQHCAVHDAQGNGLVIECIDGRAVLNDNPVRVLTNLPNFSWHLTNLGMYAHLSKVDSAKEPDFNGLAYTPPGIPFAGPLDGPPPYLSTGIPGVGNGLAGIPGDFRPPSRFVRIAYLNHFAVPPTSHPEAVNQAFHLLNSVDIVKGAVTEIGDSDKKKTVQWYAPFLKSKQTDEVSYDTARIVIVKNLIDHTIYVRRYESPLPYSVTLEDLLEFARTNESSAGTQLEIPTGELAQKLPLRKLPHLA